MSFDLRRYIALILMGATLTPSIPQSASGASQRAVQLPFLEQAFSLRMAFARQIKPKLYPQALWSVRRDPIHLPNLRPAMAAGILTAVLVLASSGLDAAERLAGRAHAWMHYFMRMPISEAIKNARGLDEVSLFWFDLTDTYHLRAGTEDRDKQTYQDALGGLKTLPAPSRPRVIATVVNDVIVTGGRNRLKDAKVLTDIFSDASRQSVLIQELVELAKDVDGIEIDFERLAMTDAKAMTAFMTELGKQLHAAQKKLYVVVVPKSDTLRGDGTEWGPVSKVVDRFTIMAYYKNSDNDPPGPAAAPDWTTGIVDYALKQGVPVNKLGVAFSLVSYRWPVNGAGEKTGPGTQMRQADFDAALAAAHNLQRDPLKGNSFRYSDNGKEYIVFFEDEDSLSAKVGAVRKRGVETISFWNLELGHIWDNWVGKKPRSPVASLQPLLPLMFHYPAAAGAPAPRPVITAA